MIVMNHPLRPKRDPYLTSLLTQTRRRLGADPLTVVPIGGSETFRSWCERLAAEGLRVDGRPFQLDDRPAMRWVYDQIPSTEDEAYRYVLVVQKSAQVGFTVFEMLAAIYLGVRFGARAVGMFMPDQKLAEMKSASRFMPVVRSLPAIHGLMKDQRTGRRSEGSVLDRWIGNTRFLYLWTSSRGATESNPMDVVSLDEVQEMTLESIEKLYERLSSSPVRFMMMGSTANWPDLDINFWYRRGSQFRFHTRCPTCGVEEPLDEYFPACIQRDGREAFYVCRDGHRIDDPQRGEWKAEHPELEEPYDPSVPRLSRPLRIRSVHFPQTLSPTISPGEILDSYNSARSLKNFYNRKLGKPFFDPNETPVTLGHLRGCVKAGAAAGAKWLKGANGTFMGIDQMGQFSVIWIKKRLESGLQQVVHVEEIYDPSPFDRCDELMEQYGVLCCVVEINPNYNEAKRFAHRFPGRVFLCNSFGEIEGDMVQWGDTLTRSDRRTTTDAQDRYTVRIDQFKCMQWAFSRFTRTECLMPDPKKRVQEVREKGERRTEAVLERAFVHFTKTALVTERDEENGTNRYKKRVRKIGIDPHHSYANMLCDVAMARAHGTSSFLFPEPDEVADSGSAIETVTAALSSVGIAQRPTAGTCGACKWYERGDDGLPLKPSGRCGLRHLIAGYPDFKCDGYESSA